MNAPAQTASIPGSLMVELGKMAIVGKPAAAAPFAWHSVSAWCDAAAKSWGYPAEIIKQTYYADEIAVQPDHRQDEEQTRRAVVRPGAILELFKTPYGIRTLLVSVLVVTQAVEFYGISLYTPKILTALLGDRVRSLASGEPSLGGSLGAGSRLFAAASPRVGRPDCDLAS